MELGVVITAVLRASAAVVLAVLPEAVSERAGVLNLGLEGVMLVGGLVAVEVAVATGSIEAGVVAGAAAGLLLGALYALMVNGLKLNQVIASISLYMLGVSLSTFFGRSFEGVPLPQPIRVSGFELVVLAAFAAPLLVYLLLRATGFDAKMRAAGDDPLAADMMGVDVAVVRSAAVAINGLLAGAAGALYITTVVRTWRALGTAGVGWLSIALTPVTLWNPLFSYIPGLVYGVALYARMVGAGAVLPDELANALPYLVVLGVAAIVVRLVKGHAPRALGRVYVHGG